MFLSSDAFKGVKKAKQKRSFISKSVVTNNNTCNAAKTKKPYKINFLMQTKTSSPIFIFSRRGDVFTFVKILILGGYFQFLLNKKGLNRDIDYTAKTKKTLLKGDFGQSKNITSKITGILRKQCFLICKFLTFKGYFWFRRYLVYFVRIDYFNFVICLGHI